MRTARTKGGFGLIEVIIAASIISLVISALIGTTAFFLKTSLSNTTTLQAGYLLEEGVEALKLIRDEGWTAHISSLTLNTPYYLHWNGSNWTATTSTSTVDSVFYRTFTLGSAYRDGNSDLASSGSLDVGTRKATVTVTWYSQSIQATTSKSIVTYITDLFEN